MTAEITCASSPISRRIPGNQSLWREFEAAGAGGRDPSRPRSDDPALVLPGRPFRWSHVAPATAPSMITAPVAMNQVRRVNSAPDFPFAAARARRGRTRTMIHQLHPDGGGDPPVDVEPAKGASQGRPSHRRLTAAMRAGLTMPKMRGRPDAEWQKSDRHSALCKISSRRARSAGLPYLSVRDRGGPRAGLRAVRHGTHGHTAPE